MTDVARCRICGEPMPPGEEMFKFHGYSGDCPKPPLTHFAPLGEDEIERIKIALMYQQMFLPSRMIRAVLAEAVLAPIGEDQSDLVKRVVAVMQDFRYRRLQNAVVDGVTTELRADLTREAEASAILEAAHISSTSGRGREMPTREEIAKAIHDALEETVWPDGPDDDGNRGDGAYARLCRWPDYFREAADAVLALFPAPGKETT